MTTAPFGPRSGDDDASGRPSYDDEYWRLDEPVTDEDADWDPEVDVDDDWPD